MDKPAETLLFEFLEERIQSAAEGEIFHGLDLHDTIYQSIKKDSGIRISDAVGAFSPGAEDEEKEYDVFISLACFARVKGKDKNNRIPALITAFLIQKAVYSLLRSDPTFGGRVCDSLLQRGARGYDEYDGEPFAVASVNLVINPSGERYARSYYDN
jgi:hypothetical protein